MLCALVLTAQAAPLGLAAAPGGGLRFEIATSAGEVRGTASEFTATLDPEAGSGRLAVAATSLSTGNGPRDQRLLVFALEVARFPEITFTASRVEGSTDALAAGSGTGALRLVGQLVVRDVTAAAVVHATFAWEGQVLRLRGHHDLSWSAFGMPDPSVLLARVGPTARVSFDLEGERP